ncbi:hypothetical protein AAE478_007632 [Parahypoxylon ruwenzoriense]
MASGDITNASGPSYSCSICFRNYKRREHLQRHVASHNPLRPYRCEWCNSSYHRADVLKRHSQICPPKAVIDGALVGSSTRRRKACDRCARQKKACSTGQPCENCRRKSVGCYYSFGVETAEERMDEENASCQSHVEFLASSEMLDHPGRHVTMPSLNSGVHSLPTVLESYVPEPEFLEYPGTKNLGWLDFFSLATESLPSNKPGIQLENYSFHFLDRFTSRSGLADSFDCGTPAQRVQVVSAFLEAEFEPPATSSAAFEMGSDHQDLVESDPASASPSLLIQPQVPRDPLIIKTHQILLLVQEVVTMKPRNSCVKMEWSAILEQRCLQFFSPPNLRKFLTLYWEIWHPNVNIIHRPSFNSESSKSILIAGMALIGASLSPDATDNENSKSWFNCVEEMVFTDDDFCSDPFFTSDSTTLSPVTNMRKIQALQAGYIVCLYQNWEGTDASKRRIRRYRFSTLVSVARDIGITTARHLNYGSAPQYEFDWKDFAAREQLIRTFLWIYLLDQAFVIFNNLPPRMVIKEMDMHMAWPEAIFQAATSAECAQEVQKWLLRCAPICNITTRETVESFCKSSLGPNIRRCFADMGPLNLFVIVSGTEVPWAAFHTLVFQQQNSSLCNAGQLQAIRYALHNWKLAWETYSSEFSSSPPHDLLNEVEPSPGNMWRRIGFMRHSPEYWLLASLLVSRLSHNIDRPPMFNTSTANDSASLDPILNKYDQTSMRQVNDLIAEFQNIRLN